MATFQFIAKDAEGNETRGQIEAGTRNEAIAAVRAQGLFPTAMGEVRSSAPAETPMISATFAAVSAPPATHLFVGAWPAATAAA